MTKIRAILIGCGKQMMNEVVQGLMDCDYKYELVGLCDQNPNTLEEAKTQVTATGNIPVYSDHKKAIEDLKPDVAIIALPHHLHAKTVLECLDMGVRVIKEKPLSISLDEAKFIRTKVEEKKLFVFTITKRKFYDSVRVVKNYVESTNPYAYNYIRFIARGTQTSGWRAKKELAGGGVILDLGYHLIGTVQHLFGNISSVKAEYGQSRSRYAQYETEDYASLLVKHATGITGTLTFGAMTGHKTEELSILTPDAFIGMENERILLKRLDKDLQEISRIESDYSQTGNVYSRIFQEIDPFDTQQSLKNIDEQIAILTVIDQIYNHHEL
jgi:predicted dehydrogenase